MGKFIKEISLSLNTLAMSECTDGFWLWDSTREMNLGIKEKSSEEALVAAIEYYQNRLATVEGEYNSLKNKVGSFLDLFKEDDD